MPENVKEKSGCCRRRKHFDNRKGNQLSGKGYQRGKLSDHTAKKVKKTGGAQNARGSHKSDESWDKAGNGEYTAFGSLNKRVIHTDAGKQTVNKNRKYEKRNHKIGNIQKKFQDNPSFLQIAVQNTICVV